ncbi:MAG: transposase [Kiritimatiellae bacterium]|nr:transposase [Kiritimatiellia bacterium]
MGASQKRRYRNDDSKMKPDPPRRFPGRPPRLATIFQAANEPLYFVTITTWNRQPILASSPAHQAFLDYANANAPQGRAIGRYVLMPDHAHFFVRLAPGHRLTDFVRLLKQHMTRTLQAGMPSARIWQPGFFDHVLRSDESYSEKWLYVRENPVRAGLVKSGGDWPYQGEVVRIDRA